ncbi:hypothetical protein ONZ45_g5770 [Pleurotus djamor]|nr:hypothetical protein ONZ45_g5770 [Pleurotus djamor]
MPQSRCSPSPRSPTKPTSPVDISRGPSSSSSNDSRPHCPTYDQYKQVEATYLQSLTSRRRAKALITQATFEKIWVVLQNPDSTTAYCSAFRFWVRKMFTLGEPPETMIPGLPYHNDSPTLVILHDGLPIAIEEHMYDILCYCHEASGHGGRDKTCSFMRKRYSWVPKELVTKFIRQCPTCNIKRCGGEIHPSPASESREWTQGHDSPLTDLHDKLALLAEERMDVDFSDDTKATDSFPSGPISPTGCFPVNASLSQASTMAVESFPLRTQSLPMSRFSASAATPQNVSESAHPGPTFPFSPPPNSGTLPMSRFTSSGSSTSSTSSVPMSREVSLFGGLPNGWQYFSDYSDAYNEFALNKERNIPSVAERLARRQQMAHPKTPNLPFQKVKNGALVKSEGDEGFGGEFPYRMNTLPPMSSSPLAIYSELPAALHDLRAMVPSQDYIPIDPVLLGVDPAPSIASVLGPAFAQVPIKSDSDEGVVMAFADNGFHDSASTTTIRG